MTAGCRHPVQHMGEAQYAPDAVKRIVRGAER